MTQEQMDLINKAVWFIPFKNKRNAVRNFLSNIVENINIINSITQHSINQNNQITDLIQQYINQNNQIKDLIILANRQRYFNVLLNMAININTKTFQEYKNINKGKEVVLVATGSTLNNFIPLDNKIYLGVNYAYFYDKIKLDYLFMQDNRNNRLKSVIDALKHNKNIEIFCGVYGMNDFKGQISEQDCIDINAKRYVLNDTFDYKLYEFEYDICSVPLYGSYSIAMAAMQFILWTNPSKIYLVGCDNSQTGYFYNSKNDLNYNIMYTGWEKLKTFKDVFYPHTEIISINPIGLKGLFNKDIYTKDGVYIDENGNELNII